MTVYQAKTIIAINETLDQFARIDTGHWLAWMGMVHEARAIVAHSERGNNCPYWRHAADCDCGGMGGDR